MSGQDSAKEGLKQNSDSYKVSLKRSEAITYISTDKIYHQILSLNMNSHCVNRFRNKLA